MNPLKKWLKRFLIGGVILYGGICLFMYLAQEMFLFHPTLLEKDHDFAALGTDLDWSEVWLDTEDGARINGLHFRADSAVGAVLYLHGNGGNVEICADVADRFVDKGHDFFLIDYRGYGKSKGDLSEEGLHADAEAAWNYLTAQYPPEKIIVYGQSMGSGMAVPLAARHTPRLLLLETPYSSIEDVAHGQYPWLPIPWLLNYPLRSTDHIGDVQCRVVSFHGTGDKVVPYELGKKLIDGAQNGTLHTFSGISHKGVKEQPEYLQLLAQYLDSPDQ